MAKLKKRDELKEDFIRYAEELTDAAGFQAVQARSIAERAGCSVGTIYNSFENIDGLLLAMNARTLTSLGESLKATLAANAGATLTNKMWVLASGYLDFAVAHTKRWKAVFEHNMSDRHAVPVWYRQSQAPLFDILAAVLPADLSDHQRETAARMLFSAAHGVVALALDEKLSDQFDRAATEEQLRMLVQLISRGLADK
jgi:AcrR family transcriptional regulator